MADVVVDRDGGQLSAGAVDAVVGRCQPNQLGAAVRSPIASVGHQDDGPRGAAQSEDVVSERHGDRSSRWSPAVWRLGQVSRRAAVAAMATSATSPTASRRIGRFSIARIRPELLIDRIEPALPIDAMLPAEPIDATQPAEPIERMEPALPIEATEPADPTDTTEPTDPIDRTENTEPIESTD
ncbi:MAG: hypothetical protein AAGE98_10625 [Actinomycetota bacterium]